MATVSKKIADEIIKGDGYYADDPRVMRVVQYTNMAGVPAYGIEYAHEVGKYAESVYVQEPMVYWSAEG